MIKGILFIFIIFTLISCGRFPHSIPVVAPPDQGSNTDEYFVDEEIEEDVEEEIVEETGDLEDEVQAVVIVPTRPMKIYRGGAGG